MSALICLIIPITKEIYKFSCVCIYHKFSIHKCINYLLECRREYLFDKYCQELSIVHCITENQEEFHQKFITKIRNEQQQQHSDSNRNNINNLSNNTSTTAAKNNCSSSSSSSSSAIFNLPIQSEFLISNNRNLFVTPTTTKNSKSNSKENDKLVTMSIAIEADENYQVENDDDFEIVSSSSAATNNCFNYAGIEIISGHNTIPSRHVSATFYDCVEPNLVYRNHELGEIVEGTSFTISGRISKICERFSINLLLDTNDIALHINPRLPQNYIVRNCRVKNIWGNEEVTSGLPFILNRGKKFTIQILITISEYLISVNGKHFASFHHRLPYNRVKVLEVKGDVERIHFQHNSVIQYPERLITNNQINRIPFNKIINKKPILNRRSSILSFKHKYPKIHHEKQIIPSLTSLLSVDDDIDLPFYGILPEKLINGKRLLICGRVKILPHSFFINLQTGQNIWPHPDIQFHFNPRFANIGGKHIICRNSWSNGKWNQEERTEIKTDFAPGKLFHLYIQCTLECYQVYLNEKFIAEFQYRADPNDVDTIYIQGDIKLWNICLENTYNNTNIIDNNNYHHHDDGTY